MIVTCMVTKTFLHQALPFSNWVRGKSYKPDKNPLLSIKGTVESSVLEGKKLSIKGTVENPVLEGKKIRSIRKNKRCHLIPKRKLYNISRVTTAHQVLRGQGWQCNWYVPYGWSRNNGNKRERSYVMANGHWPNIRGKFRGVESNSFLSFDLYRIQYSIRINLYDATVTYLRQGRMKHLQSFINWKRINLSFVLTRISISGHT